MTADRYQRDDAEGSPIDLSVLDALGEGVAWDRHVRGIRTAATPELLRRQAAQGLGGMIVHWRRSILAVSGVVALASIGILLSVHDRPASSGTAVTEALGVPGDWAVWVRSGGQPSPGELLEVEREAR